jgi:hypothetical protein
MALSGITGHGHTAAHSEVLSAGAIVKSNRHPDDGPHIEREAGWPSNVKCPSLR